MESERENVHTARTMKKNTRHRVIRDFSQHKWSYGSQTAAYQTLWAVNVSI